MLIIFIFGFRDLWRGQRAGIGGLQRRAKHCGEQYPERPARRDNRIPCLKPRCRVHGLLRARAPGPHVSQPGFCKTCDSHCLVQGVVADSDIAITEVSGTNYARRQVNINGGVSPTWDLAASGALDNTHDIQFATPGAGDWTEIVAAAIMDASSRGNILAYDNDNTVDQTPASGQMVQSVAGAFDVSLS